MGFIQTMLKRLNIVDYALIAEAEINFEKGLTVVTGESGAGKSIMLEALSLLLGARAEFSAIRIGREKSIVEAVFAAYPAEINDLLRAEGLDVFDQLIIRRELTKSGRSRAFVNDTPVSLQVLKGVGPQLIDLHGQKENMSLQSANFKWEQLDEFAGCVKQRELYQQQYREWKQCKRQLQNIEEAAAQVRKDQDYFEFQLAELDALDLNEERSAGLADELSELENATSILESLNKASSILDEENRGVQVMLRQAQRELDDVARHSQGVEEASKRMNAMFLELGDISHELSRLADRVEVNPERLLQVREQLDEINRLCHKHGVQSAGELAEIKEEYQLKLAGIASFEEEQSLLEEKLKSLDSACKKSAEALHAKRVEAAPRFAAEVCDRLRSLGMPKAHFKVDLVPQQEMTEQGLSDISMLFDANGSERLLPIEQVASGGEMARLMLSIKHVNRSGAGAATIIFDEIDTGVSGEVALKVGNVMSQLALNTQVMAVTHLPGVAAKGAQHLRISKVEDKGQVISRFDYLNKEQRVVELATMFSGEQPTENDLASARGLIGQ